MHVYQSMFATVTAPGAVQTAATAVIGSTLTTLNAPPGSDSFIYYIHALNNAQGRWNIIGEKFHDMKGINAQVGINTSVPIGPAYSKFPKLGNKETLQVNGSGSAVGGEIEIISIMAHYENVPGIETNYIDVYELTARTVTYFSRLYTLTGNSGNFSTLVNLGTGQIDGLNLFKRDKEYAILGWGATATPEGHIIIGPCTGNLHFNIPHYSEIDRGESTVRVSYNLGLPAIPVMKGMDSQNTFLTSLADNTSSDIVTLYFAELSPKV